MITVRDIEDAQARIRDSIYNSPCVRSQTLSQLTGNSHRATASSTLDFPIDCRYHRSPMVKRSAAAPTFSPAPWKCSSQNARSRAAARVRDAQRLNRLGGSGAGRQGSLYPALQRLLVNGR